MWVLRLSPVVSFHLRRALVVPVAGFHAPGILLGVAALGGHMDAAIKDSAVTAAIREGGV